MGEKEAQEGQLEERREKEGTKNVYFLGSSSFLNDVGSEAITPLIPFYISQLGGGGLAIGAVSGLHEGLSSVLKFFGGWLSDRVGKRKPLILLGYFLSSIFKMLLSLVTFWQGIVALVGLERIGKLRDAPRDALISASVKKKGRGYGIQEMMDRAGGIAGTMLAIVLFWKFGLSFRTIILIAGFVSALSLIPIIFVKEKTMPLKGLTISGGIQTLSSKFRRFLWVIGAASFANFGIQLFLILMVKEITGSTVASLAIYAAYNAVFAFLTVPFGSWSDRVGRKKVLYMGYGLFVLTAISLMFSSSLIEIIIAFFMYGVVMAFTEPNQRALASDLAGKAKGTALGAYHSVKGVLTIFGGLSAGYLWDISHSLMFGYIAAIALVAIILLSSLEEGEINGNGDED